MDEIQASPQKESQYRLHSLNHKKKSLKCLDDILSQKRRREILQPLYEDNYVFRPADLNCSSNLFEEQLKLAKAERQVTATSQRNITPSRGFQNGINLQGIVDDDDDEDLAITESELLNICDAAEKSLASPQNDSWRRCPSTPPPANTSKSIVELIFDDFCSSPSSPELTPTKRLQRTPPFVFNRNTLLRTYKKKKVTGGQCVGDNEFEEQNESASNNETACELGEPVVFVESQRICENLFNLSDFFHSEDPKNCTLNAPDADGILPSTQSSGDVYLTALEIPKECSEVLQYQGRLAKDIICYREKHPWRNPRDIPDEFYGFSNGEDNDVNGLLTASNDDQCTDDKNDFRDSDGSSNSWFEEDSDLFVNIDTTVLEAKTNLFSSSTTRTAIVPKFVGFQTASKKNIALSKEAQEKAAQILEALPELTERTKKTKKAYPTAVPPLVVHSVPEAPSTTPPQCSGFQTASNNGIELSKEAQERAARILESLPQLNEHVKKAKQAYPTVGPPSEANPVLVATSTTPQFKGFQTASNKRIQLSKEAQARAAQILASLPDLKEDSQNTKEAYPTTDNEKPSTSKAAAANLTPSTATCKFVEKNIDAADEDFENMQLSEWLSGDTVGKPHTAKEQSHTNRANDQTEALPHSAEESKRKAAEMCQHRTDLTMQFKPNGSVNTPKRQCVDHKPCEVSESVWHFELNDENCQAISCSTPINPGHASRMDSKLKCSPWSAALTQTKISRRNLLSLNKRKRKPGLSVTVDDSVNTVGCDNNANVLGKTQSLLNIASKETTTQQPVLGALEPLTPVPLKNNCRISGLRRRGRRLLTEAKGD